MCGFLICPLSGIAWERTGKPGPDMQALPLRKPTWIASARTPTDSVRGSGPGRKHRLTWRRLDWYRPLTSLIPSEPALPIGKRSLRPVTSGSSSTDRMQR